MPTINDLCEKYDVTRSTLYSWINAGNVATIKEGIKTVVPDEELHKIEDVRDWLGKNNPLKNYVPTTSTSAIDITSFADTADLADAPTKIVPAPDPLQLSLFVDLVADKISSNFGSPLKHWDELERAAQNNYIISSKEITVLLSVRPHGKIWERGAFRFTHCGKIGNQKAWMVSKINGTK
jgi:hypothetical protein